MKSVNRRSVFYGLTVTIIIAIIAVIDLLLGAFLPYDRPRHSTQHVVPRPSRVYQFKPNLHFYRLNRHYQTNSIGFRDRDYTQRKAAGTTRVFVLGDSFIEGFGEQQNETIPAHLKSYLQLESKMTIEVFNCGIGGASPGQYKYWLRALLPYDPDVVVVAMFMNDIHDDIGLLTNKNFYLARTWWRGVDAGWNYSSIAQYVRGFATEIWFMWSAERRAHYPGVTLLEKQDYNGRAYQDDAARWEKYWHVTRQNLDEIHALCREKSIPLIVVLIPRRAMFPLKPSSFEPKQDNFSDWWDEWAANRGVPHLNLVRPITAWYQTPASRHALYQTDLQHFNARGLRQAAYWIALEIQRHRLLNVRN